MLIPDDVKPIILSETETSCSFIIRKADWERIVARYRALRQPKGKKAEKALKG